MDNVGPGILGPRPNSCMMLMESMKSYNFWKSTKITVVSLFFTFLICRMVFRFKICLTHNLFFWIFVGTPLIVDLVGIITLLSSSLDKILFITGKVIRVGCDPFLFNGWTMAVFQSCCQILCIRFISLWMMSSSRTFLSSVLIPPHQMLYCLSRNVWFLINLKLLIFHFRYIYY